MFSIAALGLLSFPRQRNGALRPKPPANLPRVMDLLSHAPLRAVFMVSALLSMGWDMFTFLAPLHGARLGLSATSTGLFMGAFGAGTFAIRLFLPMLAARSGEWNTLRWALFVTAVCSSATWSSR